MRRQKVHALGASTRLWCQAPLFHSVAKKQATLYIVYITFWGKDRENDDGVFVLFSC